MSRGTRIVGGRIGDPKHDIVGQPVPVVLPDPATLFLRRADRLDHLAADNAMADFLRFLACIARAQHVAAIALPTVAPVDVIEGAPPLAYATHRRDPCWQAALHTMLQAIDATPLPDAAREAMQHVAARDPDALAEEYIKAEVPSSDTGKALYVAAALQAYFAHRAAALPLPSLHLLPERGRCPVCGAAPLAGVITAAGPTPGVRYLHCALCATAWNFVRATCIACGGSRGVGLMQIEGGNGAVQAETCDDCHSYAKMLYQANDMAVEPLADDIASLGLDMLVTEAGYHRDAPNPFVIG